MHYSVWEAAKFGFFGLLEFFSTFALMIWAFRFRLRDFWGQMICIGVLMASISWIIRHICDFSGAAPLVLMASMTVSLSLMTGIRLFWSMLMCSLACLGFMAIQILVIFVPDLLGWYELESVDPFGWTAHLLQALTAAIYFGLACLIKHYRLGVTYVSRNERGSVAMKGNNLSIFILIIVTFILAALIYQISQYPFIVLLMIVNLVLLIYLIYIQEKQSL